MHRLIDERVELLSETTQVWRILARTAPETSNPSFAAPHDAEARFEARSRREGRSPAPKRRIPDHCVNCDVQALWRNRAACKGRENGREWLVVFVFCMGSCASILGPVASGQSKFIRAVAQKSSKGAFLAF